MLNFKGFSVLAHAVLYLTPSHDCTQQVHQALLNQTNGCSVLLITNKMSVVETADHIIVLNNGVVQEEGCRDELMRKGGLYAQLVKKQNVGFHCEEEGRSDTH